MAKIDFHGRVALITGAGGGLGRTYALSLAERGAKVVVNDLGGNVDGSGQSSSMADKVVAEIKGAGGEAIANYDSVSTPAGGEAMIQAAVSAFGRIDIVINNAGILRDKSFAKMSPEELELVLDVHLKGAFYVSQPAFKVMKEQGYGRFIFTSSAAGLFGNFGQANYAAAKRGLVGLSNVLAIEGARSNITSNVIAPLAKTRLSQEALGAFQDSLEPEFVTPMVVYLVSEQCKLTHEVFSVGGGRFARVVTAVTPGWFSGNQAPPKPEDVAEHLGKIMETDGWSLPMSAGEEIMLLAKQLQG